MKQLFKLRAKPFSLNAATYGDARTKTRDYYDWQAQIFHQLSSEINQLKLQELREFFDESRHSFKVHIKALYPKDQYVTKQGILSSRTVDLTNSEKLIQDLFFDKQYFDRQAPYGCKNLNANDKHVIALFSEKTFHDSPDYILQIAIKIIPRKF